MNRDEWRQQVQEEALDPALPIIDAQHHLWETPPVAWMEPYDVEAALADKMASGHNVVATVYLEAHSHYRVDGPEHLRVVGETEFADAAAEDAMRRGGNAAGLCAAIIPHANLLLGTSVGEVLDAHLAASSRVRGIRHMTTFDTDFPAMNVLEGAGTMMEPLFREGFAELAPRNLSYDAWLVHPQLAELVDLARTFPDTSIILNHLGGPIGVGPYSDRGKGFDAWRGSLTLAAACPNVRLKIGSLAAGYAGVDAAQAERPMTSQEMADRWRDHIRTAIDLFGPDRCMFESNFPVDMGSTSYVVLWNAFKRVTLDMSASERADLFSGVASRAYRI